MTSNENRYCIARVFLVYVCGKIQNEEEEDEIVLAVAVVLAKAQIFWCALMGPPDFQYWQPMTDSTEKPTLRIPTPMHTHTHLTNFIHTA